MLFISFCALIISFWVLAKLVCVSVRSALRLSTPFCAFVIFYERFVNRSCKLEEGCVFLRKSMISLNLLIAPSTSLSIKFSIEVIRLLSVASTLGRVVCTAVAKVCRLALRTYIAESLSRIALSLVFVLSNAETISASI